MPYTAFDIPPLMVLDGFAPDPNTIRQEALKAGFEDLPYQDRIYRGTGMKYQPVHILPKIAAVIGHPIIPELSCFRLADEKEKPDAAVHSDNTTGEYAAMLYLTPNANCKGGTAFWRHKKTGWHGMPNQQEFDKAKYTKEKLLKDWKNPNAWELTGLVELRYNRFVCYPSSRWHSRYPLQGWGTSEAPETARLTYNLFFNLTDTRTIYPKP